MTDKKHISSSKLSQEEINWLIRHYATASVEELRGHFPTLTHTQIVKKANRLGLRRESRNNFTEEEIEFIRTNYDHLTAQKIAEHFSLRHSAECIMNKAASLNITKIKEPPRKWSKEEEAWLIKHYANSTKQEIIKRFPNDAMSKITAKTSALGLSRKVAKTIAAKNVAGKTILTKKCATCREVKPIDEFKRSSRNSSGFSSYCKKCAWESEKKRRENLDEKKKEDNRTKERLLKAEERLKNPERSREICRRSYFIHKPERNATQHKKYEENPDYFKKINKRWRLANAERIKANNLNRKAMKKALPHSLTKENLLSLIGEDGSKCCALTGETSDCHYCHFIPLKWGHGGSYLANIFLALGKLNISMRTINPFEWFEVQEIAAKLNAEKVAELITRLAAENNMTVEEFREFIYWCEQNKRTLEEVQADSRTSVELWHEARSKSNYFVKLPPNPSFIL